MPPTERYNGRLCGVPTPGHRQLSRLSLLHDICSSRDPHEGKVHATRTCALQSGDCASFGGKGGQTEGTRPGAGTERNGTERKHQTIPEVPGLLICLEARKTLWCGQKRPPSVHSQCSEKDHISCHLTPFILFLFCYFLVFM